MRVLFVSAPEKRELSFGAEFKVGQVYDLRPDQAERWKRRGRAVDAPPEPEPAPAPTLSVAEALAAANPPPTLPAPAPQPPEPEPAPVASPAGQRGRK